MSFYDKVTSTVKKGISKAKALHEKSKPAIKRAGGMLEKYAEAQERFNSTEPKRKPSRSSSIIKKRQGLHRKKR